MDYSIVDDNTYSTKMESSAVVKADIVLMICKKEDIKRTWEKRRTKKKVVLVCKIPWVIRCANLSISSILLRDWTAEDEKVLKLCL